MRLKNCGGLQKQSAAEVGKQRGVRQFRNSKIKFIAKKYRARAHKSARARF